MHTAMTTKVYLQGNLRLLLNLSVQYWVKMIMDRIWECCIIQVFYL